MNPWVIMAGAALGAVKHQQDKKDYQEQAHLASVKTRWSPWTGMKGEVGKRPSAMGSIMQGGLAGAAMGQQMGDDDDPAPDAPEAPQVGDDGLELTDEPGGQSKMSDGYDPDDWRNQADADNRMTKGRRRTPSVVSSPGSTYSMSKKG